MADLKEILVLALAAAAVGCSDTVPAIRAPLDRFYFPVGLAVRRLPAEPPAFPEGRTALVVVSSNFDLRYDFDVGGAVHVVDPDASGDARPVAEGGQGDPTLAVLGALNIGSFGGEVAYLAGTEATEYAEGVCPALAAADPQGVGAGGAKVVVASRGTQQVYRIDMDARGGLACDGCALTTPLQALDPYDVAAVCSGVAGGSGAKAYVTHLRAPGNEGLLTELDLVGGGSRTLSLGAISTFSATFQRETGRLFVSSRLGPIDQAPLRWFRPFSTLPPDDLPVILAYNVGTDVRGALTRQLATSGSTGYLRVDLYDYDLAARSGAFIATGGALAVYDLTQNAIGEPTMRLLRVVPTCFGSGQVRVLPPRPGAGDLLAMTCDVEGVLLFYDNDVGVIAGRMGLDPVTGRPLLGRQPFGLAVEARDAGRCLRGPGPCTRLYVSSFDSSWVSLVELDEAAPGDARIVKRIGRERD